MSEVKEYLSQIKRLDNMIDCQLSEVSRIEDMLTRVTPVMRSDGSSGCGFGDKIADGVAKMVDLRTIIDKSVDELADKKSAILVTLRKMNQPEYVKVLYLRYFKYHTWEEIAAEMKYSYRGICYLHGRALIEFEKAMNEKEVKTYGKEDDA